MRSRVHDGADEVVHLDLREAVHVLVPEEPGDLAAPLTDDDHNHRRKPTAGGSKRREVGEGPVHVAQRAERTHDQMAVRVSYAELIEQPRAAITVPSGCRISFDRERANPDDLPRVSQIQQLLAHLAVEPRGDQND